MPFMLSTVLSFAGLLAAVAVLIVHLLCLLRTSAKLSSASFMAVSIFYGYTLIANLIRQSSGLACAISPIRTLVVYGGLLVLHLYFFGEGIQTLKKLSLWEEECPS